MPLSQMAVRNAKPKDKDYKLTDGEGMFLFVTKAGGKFWRWSGRTCDLGYFDEDAARLEPIEDPFGRNALPMSQE